MKKIALSAALVASLSLGACMQSGTGANGGWGTKQTVGTGLGAVAGGLAGSQVGKGSGRLWATGAGVLLGALAGSEIGGSLDRADKAYMGNAQVKAHNASVGETINWNNPESGNSGYVTPLRDGRSASGRYCREYQTTINVGGRTESGYGTACQQPDGSWEVIN